MQKKKMKITCSKQLWRLPNFDQNKILCSHCVSPYIRIPKSYSAKNMVKLQSRCKINFQGACVFHLRKNYGTKSWWLLMFTQFWRCVGLLQHLPPGIGVPLINWLRMRIIAHYRYRYAWEYSMNRWVNLL